MLVVTRRFQVHCTLKIHQMLATEASFIKMVLVNDTSANGYLTSAGMDLVPESKTVSAPTRNKVLAEVLPSPLSILTWQTLT